LPKNVKNSGVVKLKDAPNQLGTEITLIARIALHLSYSDLTTPPLLVNQSERFNRSLVMVLNVRISFSHLPFSFGVMTQATTVFLCTSRPAQCWWTTCIAFPPCYE
jgi:hypothetical protein